MATSPDYIELKFTIEGTYRVKVEYLKDYYQADNAEEAAAVDEKMLQESPSAMIDYFLSEADNLTLQIKPA